MVGSGPQQTSPPHAESVNVNQQGELHNLEQENHVDNQRESSSRTIHGGRSGYRRRSHLVQEHADEEGLQRQIENLKKKLRWAQRNQTPSSSNVSSNDEGEDSYEECSETPPSESYSYEDEHYHKRRRKGSSRKGVGTKVMKKALSQISKSPLYSENRKGKAFQTFSSAYVFHVQWTYRSCRTCKPIQTKDGGLLSGRSFVV